MRNVNDLPDIVVQILAVELKASREHVRRAKSLRNELGLDSIGAANATFALEDELGIEIEIHEEDTFDTIDDIVGIVLRTLGPQ